MVHKLCGVALAIPIAFFLFVPTISYSGWFGPPDYDDCILEHIKGTTSESAVLYIKISCRRASQSKSWFGAPTYDECILENMQGVDSDSAAISVVTSCRRKSK
jgi:hypothetical protein